MKPQCVIPQNVDWDRSRDRDRALDQAIGRLVPRRARVLDLGCGNGDLLLRLKADREVDERGVELDPDAVTECLSRGLSVIQADLGESLADLRQDSFDVVVLNQVVLVTPRPLHLLQEALRVGRRVLVSFPNFTWWRIPLANPVSRSPAGEPGLALPVARHSEHPPGHGQGFSQPVL